MLLTAKDIRDTISESQSLKLVASAYSDLAGSRLMAIRSSIERNRLFVTELAAVFHLVKEAADSQKITLPAKKLGAINLVITSNHHFYGGLETRLMEFFVAHSALSYGDTIVVGRTGSEYLKGANFSAPFDSLIFAQDMPTTEELGSIIQRLIPHQRVFVYHSKFQSVLLQRPIIAEVGGIADISITQVPSAGLVSIFEPELGRMMEFFDRQVTGVLVEQAFLESELARTAARLVSMEDAQHNADTAVKQQHKLLTRVERSVANAKTLEMILSVVNLKTVHH